MYNFFVWIHFTIHVFHVKINFYFSPCRVTISDVSVISGMWISCEELVNKALAHRPSQFINNIVFLLFKKRKNNNNNDNVQSNNKTALKSFVNTFF